MLIKTNDPEFVKQIRKVLSIISQLRSEDGSISSSIAMPLVGIMEIEIFMYHNHLEVWGFAAFLLPAIRDCSKKPSLWRKQASVS